MRAHDRAVQPPAHPCLVACLGLIARLQLLLQLPHKHVHQVLFDSLHRARVEELRRQARLAQPRPARRNSGCTQREGADTAPAAPIAASAAASHSRGGGRSGRGGRGGRGRKSAATKAAQKASLAAFLAAKYGTEGSRTARAAADQQAGSDGADGEVQILGEQTWQDRDAAAREAAVELEE